MEVVKQCATTMLTEFYKLFPSSQAQCQAERATSPTNVQDIFAPCTNDFLSSESATDTKREKGSSPIAIRKLNDTEKSPFVNEAQYATSPPEISDGGLLYATY